MTRPKINQTFIETFNFENISLKVRRIKNLDELVDQVTDDLFNEDERLPYWAELWPSSVALTDYIFNSKNHFKAKQILELGCGLGLTTMALTLSEPEKIVATDYETSALKSAKENFQLNNLPLPDFLLLDWRDPELDQKFDYIVASDVVYEERFFKPLINIFRQLLLPGGKIILAEPNRSIARSFFTLLNSFGFDYSFKTKLVRQDIQEIQVTIYTIFKKR